MVSCLLLSCWLAAVPFDDSRPDVADVADVEAARAALQKLVARHEKLATMTASFVQEIRTPLAKKPLVSRGQLYFRRSPACAVFELTEPRRSIVRFDERAYRVYRPEEKRAEIFLFGSDDLAGAFVRVFAPKADDMEKAFRIAGSRTVEPRERSNGGDSRPASIEIRLVPLKKNLAHHFTELVLTLVTTTGAMERVAYTNAQGDTIVITVSNLKMNSKIDPSRFDESLPPGTRTKTHELNRGS